MMRRICETVEGVKPDSAVYDLVGVVSALFREWWADISEQFPKEPGPLVVPCCLEDFFVFHSAPT